MTRIRLAVIGGGESDEHEVSLASAASVLLALDRQVYDPVCFTIRRDGSWSDTEDRSFRLDEAVAALQTCDVAFPAVHGVNGEDGALAALLRLTGVPYVGSDLSAGCLAMDKEVTKLIANSVGVVTAPGIAVDSMEDLPVEGLGTFPKIVKPSTAGSSLGLSVVHSPAGLKTAVSQAFAFGSRVLIEQFVTGREVDIAILEDVTGALRVSSILEIGLAPGRVFDGDTKYGGEPPFTVPAALSVAERVAIEEAALTLFRRLNCHGVARFDFFLTPEGPTLNEINTMPGLTARSQVPRMFEATGLGYPALIDELVQAALNRDY